MIIYGIKNCSTVKSAVGWLKKNNVEVEFYDYKKSGITAAKRFAATQRVRLLPQNLI
jgi:arsenate reductase (glutaredoxin)